MSKILPIYNRNYNLTKIQSKKKSESKGFEPIIVPTMTTPRSLNAQSDVQIQNLKTRKLFESFLYKNGKVSFEELYDIKRKHPAVLVESVKYIEDMINFNAFNIIPKVSAMTSLLAKKMLDESFGENKYKIISIGTSPSFITESMKELGADILFLPISNASYITPELYLENCFKEYPNLENITSYLEKNGVNKEELKDKTLIIIDYCNRGRTLNLVKRIINERLNIPNNQICKIDIADLLQNLRGNYNKTFKKENIEFDCEIDLILEDIDRQKVECMSNVPHYSVYSERFNERCPFSVTTNNKKPEKLFHDFENFSKPSARAYQLCVLNELDKLKGGLI